RVDEIIVFHSLSEEHLKQIVEHLKQIVEIQLGHLRARLAERRIALGLTDAARANLVRTGYDPTYGARPLKRAIQKKIETPLGRLLLKGEVRDGQNLVVDADGDAGDLRFRAEAMAAG